VCVTLACFYVEVFASNDVWYNWSETLVSETNSGWLYFFEEMKIDWAQLWNRNSNWFEHFRNTSNTNEQVLTETHFGVVV